MDPSEFVLVSRFGCPYCDALLETHASLTPETRLNCGACDRTFSSTDKTTSPFQPEPLPGFGRGVTLDRVLLPAIGLLKSHALALLIVSLWVNVVWFVVVGVPADLLIDQWRSMFANESNELVSFVGVVTGTFAVGLLIASMSAYAMIVMVRLSLRISRYGARRRITLGEALSHWKVPLRAVWDVGVLFITMGVMLAATVVIGLVGTLSLSLMTDPRSATLIGTFGMGTMLIGFVFAMQWLLWPVLFLIADERANLTTAVRWGVRLARNHRKLSISLVTVYFLLTTLGSLLFYVGQVVTTPIAIVPLAIGYLKMTGSESRH